VIQPILLRPVEAGFELVVGERRDGSEVGLVGFA
jgi:hypothetical protein